MKLRHIPFFRAITLEKLLYSSWTNQLLGKYDSSYNDSKAALSFWPKSAKMRINCCNNSEACGRLCTYLEFLQGRPATQNFQNKITKKKLNVRDVVIIEDNLRQRAFWKMGEIIELLASNDDQVCFGCV